MKHCLMLLYISALVFSCASDCQDIQEFYVSEEFDGTITKLDSTINFNGTWVIYLSSKETVQIYSSRENERDIWRNSSVGDSIVKFKGNTYLKLIKQDSSSFKYKYYLECPGGR